MEIRDASKMDFDRIVELNEAEVQQTSPMDRQRLIQLDRLSSLHKVAVVDGRVVAFLLAMREGAAYESDNYGWFAARYPRFVYIDRVVVAADFGGRGIGASLYRVLFDHARQHEVEHITCEYNIDPPNPASRAFHERFGFTEAGTQRVAGGTKQVSLQVASA